MGAARNGRQLITNADVSNKNVKGIFPCNYFIGRLFTESFKDFVKTSPEKILQCYSQCHREQRDGSVYPRKNVAYLFHIHPQTRPSFCSAKAVSDPLVHSSPTLLCPAERTLNPLSSRWKPKGNSSPTGNIRTGTQPLHVLASWPLRTLVSRGPGSEQDLEWEDWGLVLPSLAEHTNIKSPTCSPNAPLSRTESQFCKLQPISLNLSILFSCKL